MAKFVFAYTGGQLAATPEEREEQMQRWEAWSHELGSAIIDFGNPFGAAKTVKAGGTVDGTSSALGGYSLIEAASLDEAAVKAQGCPVLLSDGAVEVYEALEM
jgi:hypothetical protein